MKRIISILCIMAIAALMLPLNCFADGYEVGNEFNDLMESFDYMYYHADGLRTRYTAGGTDQGGAEQETAIAMVNGLAKNVNGDLNYNNTYAIYKAYDGCQFDSVTLSAVIWKDSGRRPQISVSSDNITYTVISPYNDYQNTNWDKDESTLYVSAYLFENKPLTIPVGSMYIKIDIGYFTADWHCKLTNVSFTSSEIPIIESGLSENLDDPMENFDHTYFHADGLRTRYVAGGTDQGGVEQETTIAMVNELAKNVDGDLNYNNAYLIYKVDGEHQLDTVVLDACIYSSSTRRPQISVSADNDTYTVLVPYSDSNDTYWTKGEAYSSSNAYQSKPFAIPDGMHFVKINIGYFTADWHCRLTNIKINVKDAVAPSGITDSMVSLDGMYEYSGVRVIADTNNLLEGNGSYVGLNNSGIDELPPENCYIVYKIPSTFNVASVTVDCYLYEATAVKPIVSVSRDNVYYTNISGGSDSGLWESVPRVDPDNDTAAGRQRNHYKFSGNFEQNGAKYVKIELNNYTKWWYLSLTNLEITYKPAMRSDFIHINEDGNYPVFKMVSGDAETVTDTVQAGKIKAYINIVNENMVGTDNALLLMGIYEGTELVKIEKKNDTLLPDSSKTMNISIDVDSVSPNTKVYLFVWNSFSSMIPYTARYEL